VPATMSFTFAQIIVCRDQAETVANAVESVLAQSVPPDEIVIGDDASSDASPEVIRTYEAKHPERIRALLGRERVGIPANLNRCVRATSADFVSILAADDQLLPGRLEAQYAAVRACAPEHEVFYSDARQEDAGGARRLWTNRGAEGNAFPLLARRRFCMRNPLFSRRLFDEIGGYDEQLAIYEDWKLKLELALRTRVKYVPGVYSVYRTGPGGAHKLPAAEHLRAIERIRDDLEARYALGSAERRALDAVVWNFRAMAASGAGERAGATLACWRRDPAWVAHHARLVARTVRARLRGGMP
jgi:glycosyltransferase involved in cell wall biosynthesis